MPLWRGGLQWQAAWRCDGEGAGVGWVPSAVSSHGRLPAPTPGAVPAAASQPRPADARSLRGSAALQAPGLYAARRRSRVNSKRPLRATWPPWAPAPTPLPLPYPTSQCPTLCLTRAYPACPQGPEHTPSSRKTSCTTSTHITESKSPSVGSNQVSQLRAGSGEGGGSVGDGKGGLPPDFTQRGGGETVASGPFPQRSHFDACAGPFRPPSCARGLCPAGRCGDNPEGPVSGQRGPTVLPYTRWCLWVGGLSRASVSLPVTWV